jgi:predicted Zn-dependent protease
MSTANMARTKSRRVWVPVVAVFAALALLAGASPVTAQRSEDIGQRMEREYGVLGRNTEEGRRVNERFDRAVSRMMSAINSQPETRDFRLRSAKILGGASAQKDREVNAFALPDGRVYATLGLVRSIGEHSRAEDELAFVMGHEIVHVAERHSAKQQGKATQAGLLALIISGVSRNRTVDALAGLGAAAYVSSFGRRDEYRADRGGLLTMHRAGYDLNAAATMLARLQSAGGGGGARALNGWFSSHPLTENRVKRVEEMAADIRAGRLVPDRSERDLERDDRHRH